MRKRYYLPTCCKIIKDNSGQYVVEHTETASFCRHTPSGGTAGKCDGKTKCNRIIGRGKTKLDAITDAREYLELEK